MGFLGSAKCLAEEQSKILTQYLPHKSASSILCYREDRLLLRRRRKRTGLWTNFQAVAYAEDTNAIIHNHKLVVGVRAQDAFLHGGALQMTSQTRDMPCCATTSDEGRRPIRCNERYHETVDANLLQVGRSSDQVWGNETSFDTR